jgi:hypothetical protein
MKLISEEELINAMVSKREIVAEIEAYNEGFADGVSFAENKLAGISIQFFEWAYALDVWAESSTNRWCNFDGVIASDSKELFEKFINDTKFEPIVFIRGDKIQTLIYKYEEKIESAVMLSKPPILQVIKERLSTRIQERESFIVDLKELLGTITTQKK